LPTPVRTSIVFNPAFLPKEISEYLSPIINESLIVKGEVHVKKILFGVLILLTIISCETTTGPEEIKDPPTNLIVSSNLDDHIQLVWMDNSTAEIGFVIERKMAEGDFVIIDTTLVDETVFLDSEVEEGNLYSYRIYALFEDGVSEYSNEVSIELISISPTNLIITEISDLIVQLEWDDRSTGEIGFIIDRKINDMEYVHVDTTIADTTLFIDTDIGFGNQYTYRVSAIIGNSTSTWSNEASVAIPNLFEELEFGTEPTLEVVTWNIESFPKENQNTVDYVTQAILAIEADVIALQEIADEDYFQVLIEQLNRMDYDNSWAGYLTDTSFGNVNLAYIYNESNIQMNEIYEIYESNYYNRPFPRKPLIIQVTFQNKEFWIINNHLKAFGDGALDLSDPWDEETRRYDACNLLDEYIIENLPNENVIVVGDFNDRLDDPEMHNVFWNLIDEPSEYVFTDMDIAVGSSEFWSYYGRPTHLDHILITNELFDEFGLQNSAVNTLLLDSYLSGQWDEYDDYISDHRPVGLKLAFSTNK